MPSPTAATPLHVHGRLLALLTAVAVALTAATIRIRDSKSAEARPLQISPLTWTEFLGSLPPATRG